MSYYLPRSGGHALTPIQAQSYGGVTTHAPSAADKLWSIQPYIQQTYGALSGIHQSIFDANAIKAGDWEKILEAFQQNFLWPATGSLGKALASHGLTSDPNYLQLIASVDHEHSIADAYASGYSIDVLERLLVLQAWEALVLHIGK